MHRSDGRLRHSPSDLATFLASPFASWMDRHYLESKGEEDSLLQPDVQDAMSELLSRKGGEHELAVLQRFMADGRSVIDIAADVATRKAADPEAERKSVARELTIAALRRGVDVVYQGEMAGGAFAGTADFLVRVEGPSALGDHHYEVWDAKLARSVAPSHLLQLCCYADMLYAVQHRHAEHVIVATARMDAPSQGDRVRLSDCLAWYRAVRTTYLEQQSNYSPDHRPDPAVSRSFGRWSGVAEAHLEQIDHPSRIANITRGQIAKFSAAGIDSLGALAELGDRSVPGLTSERVALLAEQAILQRDSVGQEVPLWRHRQPDAPSTRGFAALPILCEADLFFDLEGYPLEQEGLEYLWGCTWRNDAGARDFRYWWAHDRQAECEAFEAFMDWAHARWQSHPAMHVYHYGHYEIAVLERLSTRFGSREQALDDMLRANVFVDLYDIVRNAILLGEPRYSIKNVEHLYRSRRDAGVANAADSVVQYDAFRSLLTIDPPAARKVLTDLLEYNRDDCDSTEELLTWLDQNRCEGVAAGSSRSAAGSAEDAPPAASPGRGWSEERRAAARLAREAEEAARAELLVRLDARAEAAVRADDVADALLNRTVAGLLEHEWREQKPLFWAYHTRRRTDDETLWEDSECIVDCRRTDKAPWRAGRSKMLCVEYTFDGSQDLKGLPGKPGQPATMLLRTDAPDHQWRKAELMLPDSDADSGRIVIRSADTLPDRATLIPCVPQFRSQKQQALNAIVTQWLADHDDVRAIDDVLRRRPPRIAGFEGGVLIDPALSMDDKLKTLIDRVLDLDGSALVIQGPPGSGKTFSSARIIAELLRQGRRVAVSSNSHAAIGNLLAAVARECSKAGMDTGIVAAADDGGRLEALGITTANNADLKQCLSDGASLVGTTVHGLSRADLAGEFNVLVVDEAGQVALADLVAMSRCARNLVLVGDQMQLGQPSAAAHPAEARLSTLDYLMQGIERVPPERGVFLDTSFRLHPAICQVVSEQIYAGGLRAASGNVLRTLLPATSSSTLVPSSIEAGIVWLPVLHEGNRQGSDEEVAVIRSVTDQLLERSWTDGRTARPLGMQDLLFVAPYNLQVGKLQRALGDDARVGTVDRFQGQEAPVVIVSLCASDANESARGLSFLFDRRRLNVAISRAQTLVVIVGHPGLPLSYVSTLEDLHRVNLVAALAEGSSGKGENRGAAFRAA